MRRDAAEMVDKYIFTCTKLRIDAHPAVIAQMNMFAEGTRQIGDFGGLTTLADAGSGPQTGGRRAQRAARRAAGTKQLQALCDVLETTRSVSVLKLDGCVQTREAAEEIVTFIKSCKTLVKFDLSHNRGFFGEPGASALLEALKGKPIFALTLNGLWTDYAEDVYYFQQVAEIVKTCPNLEVLDLGLRTTDLEDEDEFGDGGGGGGGGGGDSSSLGVGDAVDFDDPLNPGGDDEVALARLRARTRQAVRLAEFQVLAENRGIDPASLVAASAEGKGHKAGHRHQDNKRKEKQQQLEQEQRLEGGPAAAVAAALGGPAVPFDKAVDQMTGDTATALADVRARLIAEIKATAEFLKEAQEKLAQISASVIEAVGKAGEKAVSEAIRAREEASRQLEAASNEMRAAVGSGVAGLEDAVDAVSRANSAMQLWISEASVELSAEARGALAAAVAAREAAEVRATAAVAEASAAVGSLHRRALEDAAEARRKADVMIDEASRENEAKTKQIVSQSLAADEELRQLRESLSQTMAISAAGFDSLLAKRESLDAQLFEIRRGIKAKAGEQRRALVGALGEARAGAVAAVLDSYEASEAALVKAAVGCSTAALEAGSLAAGEVLSVAESKRDVTVRAAMAMRLEADVALAQARAEYRAAEGEGNASVVDAEIRRRMLAEEALGLASRRAAAVAAGVPTAALLSTLGAEHEAGMALADARASVGLEKSELATFLIARRNHALRLKAAADELELRSRAAGSSGAVAAHLDAMRALGEVASSRSALRIATGTRASPAHEAALSASNVALAAGQGPDRELLAAASAAAASMLHEGQHHGRRTCRLAMAVLATGSPELSAAWRDRRRSQISRAAHLVLSARALDCIMNEISDQLGQWNPGQGDGLSGDPSAVTLSLSEVNIISGRAVASQSGPISSAAGEVIGRWLSSFRDGIAGAPATAAVAAEAALASAMGSVFSAHISAVAERCRLEKVKQQQMPGSAPVDQAVLEQRKLSMDEVRSFTPPDWGKCAALAAAWAQAFSDAARARTRAGRTYRSSEAALAAAAVALDSARSASLVPAPQVQALSAHKAATAALVVLVSRLPAASRTTLMTEVPARRAFHDTLHGCPAEIQRAARHLAACTAKRVDIVETLAQLGGADRHSAVVRAAEAWLEVQRAAPRELCVLPLRFLVSEAVQANRELTAALSVLSEACRGLTPGSELERSYDALLAASLSAEEELERRQLRVPYLRQAARDLFEAIYIEDATLNDLVGAMRAMPSPQSATPEALLAARGQVSLALQTGAADGAIVAALDARDAIASEQLKALSAVDMIRSSSLAAHLEAAQASVRSALEVFLSAVGHVAPADRAAVCGRLSDVHTAQERVRLAANVNALQHTGLEGADLTAVGSAVSALERAVSRFAHAAAAVHVGRDASLRAAVDALVKGTAAADRTLAVSLAGLAESALKATRPAIPQAQPPASSSPAAPVKPPRSSRLSAQQQAQPWDLGTPLLERAGRHLLDDSAGEAAASGLPQFAIPLDLAAALDSEAEALTDLRSVLGEQDNKNGPVFAALNGLSESRKACSRALMQDLVAAGAPKLGSALAVDLGALFAPLEALEDAEAELHGGAGGGSGGGGDDKELLLPAARALLSAELSAVACACGTGPASTSSTLKAELEAASARQAEAVRSLVTTLVPSMRLSTSSPVEFPEVVASLASLDAALTTWSLLRRDPPAPVSDNFQALLGLSVAQHYMVSHLDSLGGPASLQAGLLLGARSLDGSGADLAPLGRWLSLRVRALRLESTLPGFVSTALPHYDSQLETCLLNIGLTAEGLTAPELAAAASLEAAREMACVHASTFATAAGLSLRAKSSALASRAAFEARALADSHLAPAEAMLARVVEQADAAPERAAELKAAIEAHSRSDGTVFSSMMASALDPRLAVLVVAAVGARHLAVTGLRAFRPVRAKAQAFREDPMEHALEARASAERLFSTLLDSLVSISAKSLRTPLLELHATLGQRERHLVAVASLAVEAARGSAEQVVTVGAVRDTVEAKCAVEAVLRGGVSTMLHTSDRALNHVLDARRIATAEFERLRSFASAGKEAVLEELLARRLTLKRAAEDLGSAGFTEGLALRRTAEERFQALRGQAGLAAREVAQAVEALDERAGRVRDLALVRARELGRKTVDAAMERALATKASALVSLGALKARADKASAAALGTRDEALRAALAAQAEASRALSEAIAGASGVAVEARLKLMRGIEDAHLAVQRAVRAMRSLQVQAAALGAAAASAAKDEVLQWAEEAEKQLRHEASALKARAEAASANLVLDLAAASLSANPSLALDTALRARAEGARALLLEASKAPASVEAMSTFVRNRVGAGDQKGVHAGVAAVLAAAGGSVTLSHLSLSHCKLGDEGASALSHLLKSSKVLTSLDLSSNNFGPGSVPLLCDALKACPHLKVVSLAQNAISTGLGEQVEVLTAALKAMPSLTSVNLSDIHIGELGAKSLAGLIQGNPRLRELGLARTHLGEHAKHIVGALAGSGLESLNLAEAKISGESAKQLASALVNAPQLKELQLKGNHLAGDAAKRISDVVVNSKTSLLHFSADISDGAAVKAINKTLAGARELVGEFPKFLVDFGGSRACVIS
jgi:Ran GTPase-activating protein (RanGAP) involved in mRNA processing and transport